MKLKCKNGIVLNATEVVKTIETRGRAMSPVTKKFEQLLPGQGLMTTKKKASYFRTRGSWLGWSISVRRVNKSYLVARNY